MEYCELLFEKIPKNFFLPFVLDLMEYYELLFEKIPKKFFLLLFWTYKQLFLKTLFIYILDLISSFHLQNVHGDVFLVKLHLSFNMNFELWNF